MWAPNYAARCSREPLEIPRDTTGCFKYLRQTVTYPTSVKHCILQVQGGSVSTLECAIFLSMMPSLCKAGFFTAVVLKIKYHRKITVETENKHGSVQSESKVQGRNKSIIFFFQLIRHFKNEIKIRNLNI